MVVSRTELRVIYTLHFVRRLFDGHVHHVHDSIFLFGRSLLNQLLITHIKNFHIIV